MMIRLHNFIRDFLDNFTLLGYISFCLLAVFIVIALFCPRENLALMEKNVKSSSYRRLNNIDFLKILLTFVIVLHHEFQATGIPDNGDYFVEPFFIISGFMLLYNYVPEMRIIDFIRKKFIYFFPYLLLGDMFALSLLENIDFAALFAGIFMYADTGLFKKFSVYAPSWYIVTLFWVFVFYFSMMKIFSKNMCSFIIGVIAFVAWSAMGNMGFVLWENEQLPILTNGQVRAFACISVGYMIALNYKPTEKSVPIFFYTILEGVELIALMLIFFVKRYELPIYLVVILFVSLLWSFIHQKGYLSAQLEKINWSPFAKYMLPIFMTHWVFTMLQQSGRLWNDYTVSLQICFALICSTLLGVAAYHVIRWGIYFQSVRDKISLR